MRAQLALSFPIRAEPRRLPPFSSLALLLIQVTENQQAAVSRRIQQELRLGQTEEDARHYSTIVPQSVTSQLKPSIPAKDPRPKKKMPEIRQPVDTAVSNDSPQGDRLLETTVFVFRRASQSAHVRDQQRTEVRSADRRALTHHSQHHRVVLVPNPARIYLETW